MEHVKDKFEYTKWVIRSRKSKKYRQRNEQKKKDNRTIIDLKNTSQKTKEYESQTPQKISKILNFALITQIKKYIQSRSTLHKDKIRMYFIWLKYCMSKIKPTIHF